MKKLALIAVAAAAVAAVPGFLRRHDVSVLA